MDKNDFLLTFLMKELARPGAHGPFCRPLWRHSPLLSLPVWPKPSEPVRPGLALRPEPRKPSSASGLTPLREGPRPRSYRPPRGRRNPPATALAGDHLERNAHLCVPAAHGAAVQRPGSQRGQVNLPSPRAGRGAGSPPSAPRAVGPLRARKRDYIDRQFDITIFNINNRRSRQKK